MSTALLGAGCSATSTASSSQIAPSQTVPFNPADNARSDVRVDTCAKSGSAWTATGIVRNIEPSPVRFQLVIDFVTVPGSTVVSTTVVTVPAVKVGQVAPWSARGARGAKTRIACLLRQAQRI